MSIKVPRTEVPSGPEAMLSTARVLRQYVVPSMWDTGDLCSLAVASSAALCAPCFARIAALSPTLGAPVGAPCAPIGHPKTFRNVVSTTASTITALVMRLAVQPTAAPLQLLVRRCPLLNRALFFTLEHSDPDLLCPGPPTDPDTPWLLRAATAAASDPLVPVDNVRLLVSVPGLPTGLVKKALDAALVGACRAGGARAAAFVRDPMFANVSKTAINRALRMACSNGSAEVFVVPLMDDTGDLCSLAVASAAALCAPCFARIAALSPTLGAPVGEPCTLDQRRTTFRNVVSPAASAITALAMRLAVQPTAAPLQLLNRFHTCAFEGVQGRGR
eukprot:m51a1_g10639 hypothetical protein (332) ;mRNA; r:3737-7823